jgi:hypothetical protein
MLSLYMWQQQDDPAPAAKEIVGPAKTIAWLFPATTLKP